MNKGYFITGTDTNVGKTSATIALMHYFQQQGKTVVGMKPVAAGCDVKEGQLKNADALLIQENASLQIDYQLVNPYAYQLPISPHLAGLSNPVVLATVLEKFAILKELAEIVLVEGAGGWHCPLNQHHDISDLAEALALPVIVVVAIKLGCINHAKLTYLAIQNSSVSCAGWIAVCLDPDMLYSHETLESIRAVLPVPLLGTIPYSENGEYTLLENPLAW